MLKEALTPIIVRDTWLHTMDVTAKVIAFAQADPSGLTDDDTPLWNDVQAAVCKD